MNDISKITPDSVSAEYQAGITFNQGIELYDCVETNEDFFVGKQWEGVDAGGLPTPVFNFIKRVTLFSVANVATENLKLNATPLAAQIPSGDMPQEVMMGRETMTDILTQQFESLAESVNLPALVREFSRNAAVDGDGCIFTYLDANAETGQQAKGAIKCEILQNSQVLFGNPNNRHVQEQPYVILERRLLVSEAREMAKAAGAPADVVAAIVADDKQGGDAKMDQLGGGKVTVLLRLWKNKETGTIWGYECTSQVEIRKAWDLGIHMYPIVWMNWDYVQDCYHGQAMVTGLIPNQIFVNKLFAMSMISLMTLAYPKIVYDRTKVRQWTNRVGSAIAVSGPVDRVAQVVGGAAISPQIAEFIDLAISYTQRFLGATDAALGDTRPDNSSAIIALQRAAATPMELVRQNLFQAIEDLGRIWMDFMGAYYGTRVVPVRAKDGSQAMDAVPFDFGQLKNFPYDVKLDVGASTYWSEIASMQTLDNLLTQGKISTVEYLKRLPKGQITDRESLIAALEAESAMGMAEPTSAPNSAAEVGEPPLRGGQGYGAFQRKINETGEIPKEG